MSTNVETDTELTLQVIQAIARSASLVSDAAVDALLHEIERTDALMPMLDPTGYIKIIETLPQHRRLVQAFRAFRRELQAISGQ